MLRFQKNQFASLTTIFRNSNALILLFLAILVALYIHYFDIRCIINLLIYLRHDFFNVELLGGVIGLPSPNLVMP